MDSQKAHILYVDDEQSNLDTFVAAFRKHYNIHTAKSAADAIEVLRQHRIAVILTDQRMPDMTGVQFLEAIIPEYPDPVRMLITGFSDIDAIIKAINNGQVFRYIAKPWNESDLKLNIDVGVKLYELGLKKCELINQMQEEANQQTRILNLFKKYVPADVIQKTIAGKEEGAANFIFEGETRIISVLFITIHGFSKYAEKKDPEQILIYLNNYFSHMVNCIEIYKGTLDKFIGSTIMALFGAPISYIDNQKNAVFCAISMLEEIKKFNVENKKTIEFEAKVGIAIHSGEVVVGNIGAPESISYTAIGDTVNTAARILEFTNGIPNTILISSSVYRSVKDNVITESLGQKEIRGKKEILDLFKVIKRKI